MKNYFQAAVLISCLVGSVSAQAAAKRTFIGECDHINGLRYKIYYTDQKVKGQHVLQVIASVDKEPGQQIQKWYAQGWDGPKGSKAFIISRTLGLAMVDGDSNGNVLFAPGIPSEPLHCKNHLKPVLKDFPL